MDISDSVEDYLRALYVLKEQDKELTVTNLATDLNIKKPSVNQMIKKIKDLGLINHTKYSNVKFTNKGKKLATKLTKKHRLIEYFLLKKLKYGLRDVHDEAHKLEHAFSDKGIERLEKFLRYPKIDPHGEIIP